jgi:hypothetical protein
MKEVFNKYNFCTFIKNIIDINQKLIDIHYRKKIYYIKYVIIDINSNNHNNIHSEVSIINNVFETNPYINIIQITQYIYSDNFVKNYEYIHHTNKSINEFKEFLNENITYIKNNIEFYRNLLLTDQELRIYYLNDLYLVQNIFDKICYHYNYYLNLNQTISLDNYHC